LKKTAEKLGEEHFFSLRQKKIGQIDPLKSTSQKQWEGLKK
jgi:hypothetical protein